MNTIIQVSILNRDNKSKSEASTLNFELFFLLLLLLLFYHYFI
jgi:hypothetical protein